MAQLSAIAPFRFHRAWTILVILIVVQVIGQAISMSAGIMVAFAQGSRGRLRLEHIHRQRGNSPLLPGRLSDVSQSPE